ncbi:MAG: hypothetical protein ABEN55_22600, partial [Bradymonadaceae bacterium]
MVPSVRWQLAAVPLLAAAVATGCDEPDTGRTDTDGGADGSDARTDVVADVRPDADDVGDSRDAGPCGPDAYRTSRGRCRPKPQSTPASECPSGRYTGSGLFAGNGICLPARPRTDAACPGGRRVGAETFRGDGLCHPRLPRLEDWRCDGDWTPAPAFVDGGGDRATPEDLGGIEICSPPERPDSCEAGTLAPAGATTCRRQGTDCPSSGDQWIAEPDIKNLAPNFSGAIHYVSARRGGTGTGSRPSPYRSIAPAIRTADTGNIVALGRGT